MIFGGLTISAGFVRQWGQMAAIRLILGIAESRTLPGIAYLVSCWYTRYEVAKRTAGFYIIGMLSSAFSGLLGYGFSHMNGLGSGHGLGQHIEPTKDHPNIKPHQMSGIAGGRWVFIMQGILTAVVAFMAATCVVDFPEKAATTRLTPKFLNKRETSLVVAQINRDRLDAVPEKFNLVNYLAGAADLQVWLFALSHGCTAINTFGIAYYLPIILNVGMGFSAGVSQCLVAPPVVFAAICVAACSWAADKYHSKGLIIIGACIVSVIGLPLTGLAKSVATRYFGTFLATAGVNVATPLLIAWQANNIRGQWKRALCSATLIMAGGIRAIIAPLVFCAQDAPRYLPGFYTLIAGVIVGFCSTLALMIKFWKANRRADAGGKPIHGLEGFRYTI
ncbi:uncharacterized protein Z518_05756 [Rhinocladiella mackenziei CBS 650.93]|uniref:Major facilitator superfamily (MFS) profile domain-containing protein n=1 Tax=Rhinocladiella mackenziei CBS 650.93 TaxID=1442369 RepID=A0A0D2J724_9EURO|nr:uncharacterized protein Z518_05756 [Rhinocladiella mackenziei CBS 650.93]KIX04885.1 hypothetical protein Z518_05756 [Rhinocladiella mackenziei CBS 650.93]